MNISVFGLGELKRGVSLLVTNRSYGCFRRRTVWFLHWLPNRWQIRAKKEIIKRFFLRVSDQHFRTNHRSLRVKTRYFTLDRFHMSYKRFWVELSELVGRPALLQTTYFHTRWNIISYGHERIPPSLISLTENNNYFFSPQRTQGLFKMVHLFFQGIP